MFKYEDSMEPWNAKDTIKIRLMNLIKEHIRDSNVLNDIENQIDHYSEACSLYDHWFRSEDQ
jgi:hypothetical protein